jgi:hypothetical protein
MSDLRPVGLPGRADPTVPRTIAPRPSVGRPAPVPSRARPDPNPVRLMLGFVGLASLSAIASGLLPSVLPTVTAAPASTSTVFADTALLPVKHVIRYVQLKPGQTAPPQAAVVAAPKPSPRVVVVTTTRQSGKP